MISAWIAHRLHRCSIRGMMTMEARPDGLRLQCILHTPDFVSIVSHQCQAQTYKVLTLFPEPPQLHRANPPRCGRDG
jgi:hypothetical protein